MADDILKSLPAQKGHFLLESGYHTDLWINLDSLFVSPQGIKPHVAALATLIRPFQPSAVCGPMLGGAFLAQALATEMGLHFYYGEQLPAKNNGGLFTAEYKLPPDLHRKVANERVAIVDDALSAGSSVRATAADLTAAGASIVVVGTFLLLGDQATEYFSAHKIPLVSLTKQAFNLWKPADCPLCSTKEPLENPAT
jgi:orotate phosphoribosyltransferase